MNAIKGDIATAFDRVVASMPDAIAVEGDGRPWTYRQLQAWSSKIASQLIESGVAEGHHVPLLTPRSPTFVAAVLGILRCGATYVPIDSKWPLSRIRFVIEDIGAKVGVGEALPASDAWGCRFIDPGSDFGPDADVIDPPERSGDSPAYVMYTSGSTGNPKGVVVPHRGILRLVLGTDYADFEAGQRWGLVSSVAFDASTLELWGALLNGGACVVQQIALPSLDELAGFLIDRRISSTWLTASLFNSLVDYRPDAFAGMKQVLTGGEAESRRHVEAFLRQNPGVRLIHGYGPTENTTFTCCHEMTLADLSRAGRIPIGKAICGTTVRILRQDGSDAADDETGELVAGGLGVALGYLNQPDLTLQRFVRLGGDDGLWYRTGDVVRRYDDGAIEFLGRIDRQVKIQGNRVELEEVERAMHECEGVTSAAVEIEGELAEDKRLVAYFSSTRPTPPSAEDVRAFLRQRLPISAVPTTILRLDEMPLGSTGKIDRTALRAKVAAMAGGSTPSTLPLKTNGFTTDTERALAAIWAKLLPTASIGPQTRFFDVGGHSLLAMRMLAEVQKELGLHAPPSAVYEHQSLAELAASLAVSAGEPPAACEVPEDEPDVTQLRMLFESRMDATGTAYVEYFAYLFPGEIDRDRLMESLVQTVNAHDGLRFRFVEQDGRQRRIISGAYTTGTLWHRHDAPASALGKPGACGDDSARSLPSPVGSSTGGIDAAVLQEVRRPLPSDAARLVRAHGFDRSGGQFLAVLEIHHMLIDEWSVDLILDEWATRYAGRAVAAAPSAQTHRVPHDTAEAAESVERLGRELAEDLGTGTPPIPLSAPVRELIFGISAEAADDISEFASQMSVSPLAVLLPAYGDAIRRTLDVASPWIMTPVSRRSTSVLQKTVGNLIATPVVRVLKNAFSRDGFDAVQDAIQAELMGRRGSPDAILAAARKCGLKDGRGLGQFAFVYRMDPDRNRDFAGLAVRSLHVPPLAPKFAVCLHIHRHAAGMACRLEASSSIDPATLDRLRVAFLARLEDRRTPDSGTTDATPAPVMRPAASTGSAASDTSIHFTPPTPPPAPLVLFPGYRRIISGIWGELLRQPCPQDPDDFFLSGGTSLMSLRLVAEVRRQTGVSIDLGRFIERPTLRRLLELASAPSEAIQLHAEFGPPTAPLTLVGIPGAWGHSVSWQLMWQKIKSAVPGMMKFLAIDMVRLEEIGDPAEGLDQVARVIRQRTAGGQYVLMGYSSGGLIALDLLRRLDDALPARVLLLDAYAAKAFRPERLRQIVRKIRQAAMASGLGRSSSGESIRLPDDDRVAEIRPVASEIERARTVAYLKALGNLRPDVCPVPTTLIHAANPLRSTIGPRYGPLNGLEPILRNDVRHVRVKSNHLSMLKDGADEVAAAILDELRLTWPGSITSG